MKRPVFYVKPVDIIPVKIRSSTSLCYTAHIWPLSSHLSLGHAVSLFPEGFIISHLVGSCTTSSHLLRIFLCTKFKDLK